MADALDALRLTWERSFELAELYSFEGQVSAAQLRPFALG